MLGPYALAVEFHAPRALLDRRRLACVNLAESRIELRQDLDGLPLARAFLDCIIRLVHFSKGCQEGCVEEAYTHSLATGLVEFAQRNPARATYASSGIGSIGHLAGELLKQRSGAPLTHVAYRGGAPAMNDLLGGQVGAMIATIPTALPHVKAGKLRALGLTSLARADAMPDVPTIAESGYPGFDATNWYAFVGPSRLAPELVTRLNAELVRALRAPEVREQLRANGMEPIPSTAAAMARHIEAESALWAKVVKDGSIKLE